MNLCPVCIEELVPNKKRLGLRVNWLVCPQCGYRYSEGVVRRYCYSNTRKDINNSNTNPFNTTLP